MLKAQLYYPVINTLVKTGPLPVFDLKNKLKILSKIEDEVQLESEYASAIEQLKVDGLIEIKEVNVGNSADNGFIALTSKGISWAPSGEEL